MHYLRKVVQLQLKFVKGQLRICWIRLVPRQVLHSDDTCEICTPVVGAPGILVPFHDQHRIQLSLFLLRVREVTKYNTWDANRFVHVVLGVDNGVRGKRLLLLPRRHGRLLIQMWRDRVQIR